MARGIILGIVAALLLSVGPVQSSPVVGHYREARLHQQSRIRLQAGEIYQFHGLFQANERACVMVEGDHKPPVNLFIKVFDPAGKLVAEDKAGGDFIAVMWYPPRNQEYRIAITGDGEEWNDLDVVVK